MGIGGGLCCVVRALLSGRDLPEIRLEISAKKDLPVTRDTGQPNSCFDLFLDEDQIATGNIIVNQRGGVDNIRQLDSNVSAATITIGIN